MKKHLKRFVRLILLLLVGIVLYVIAILVINTALDYRPEGGEFSVQEFQTLETVETGDTLGMLSWNIGYAGLGKGSDFFYDGGKMARPSKADFKLYQKGIMKKLRSQDALDFLLLQEVDINSRRSYKSNQYGLIAEQLASHKGLFAKNYDVAFVPMPVFSPMGSVESGLAFFTKKKIFASIWEPYEAEGSWPLGLFLPDRCYSVSVFETDTQASLYVFNTHNSAFDDGSQRNSQLEQLYAAMEKAYAEGNYVIAGGDWNLNPCGYQNAGFQSEDISFSIDKLQEVCGPGIDWQIAFDPGYPTNRDVSTAYEHGKTRTTTLDFFVCSPNVTILEVSVLYDGFADSDHQAIRMKFMLD